MNLFGWFIAFMFFLSLFSPEATNKQRVIALLIIFGILYVGTGNGVL